MVTNHLTSPPPRHDAAPREEKTATAAGLLIESHRYRPEAAWRGPSGMPISGAEAEAFLDAVIDLLEREKSWTGGRTPADDKANSLDAVDETSILDMVRALFRWLREELRDSGPTTVDTAWRAMYQVADSKAGDDDTRTVAERCVDMILRARTGASTTSLSAWEKGVGRTWSDVRDLLKTAAVFAREYGPTGPTGAWQRLPELRHLVQAHSVWTQSGMVVTGDQVARSLTAAAEWLEQEGWGSSTWRYARHALSEASSAARDKAGAEAAGDLLSLMVQHRTGSAGRVEFDAWEKWPDRTWDEVRGLLETAAAFAREHGPSNA